MASAEVVQLYLTHPGVAGAPLRALKGFHRVNLERGQKKTISFRLRDRDLSVVDQTGRHRVPAGRVELWVGGGQPVRRSGLPDPVGARTQFTITGEATLPQ
jgi:beta-glucosidase